MEITRSKSPDEQNPADKTVMEGKQLFISMFTSPSFDRKSADMHNEPLTAHPIAEYFISSWTVNRGFKQGSQLQPESGRKINHDLVSIFPHY